MLRDPANATHAAIEKSIREWAALNPDIHSIIVYGSQAAHGRSPDAYSDLDVIIFTSQPDRYLANSSWLREIGVFWIAAVEPTGAGDPEWFVLFEGGLKVDIILGKSPIMPMVEDALSNSPYASVIPDGIRYLYRNPHPRLDVHSDQDLTLISIPGDTRQIVNLTFIKFAKAVLLFRRGDYLRLNAFLSQTLIPHLRLVLSELNKFKGVPTASDAQSHYSLELAVLSEKLSLIQTASALSDLEMAPFISGALEWAFAASSELSEGATISFPDEGQAKAIEWLRSAVSV